MASTTGADRLETLLGLARAAERLSDVDEFLAEVLPRLCVGVDAQAGAVFDVRSEPRHEYGVALPTSADPSDEEPDGRVVPAPVEWSDAGLNHALLRRLPGHLGVLNLGWKSYEESQEADAVLAAATAIVVGALARQVAESELADLVARVANAQRLASMGDYDWHIASDTNRWSDQLYRIYGFEPQTFNASYERFLASVHPDDRERIQEIHQQAYATGEPYTMIERIVRPSGEVRYLASNGQVLMDASGAPERMRGTCVDITERILAEHEVEEVAARFEGLVNASPYAIVMVDEPGTIVQANPRATELLEADPTGRRLEEFGLDLTRTGLAVSARSLTGRELVLDVSATDLGDADARSGHALFLADATTRLDREAMAQRLGEAQQRRRQALEINDNVVQGLSAAMLALEEKPDPVVFEYIDRTLAAARRMMDGLVEPTGPHLVPGDLVRTHAATLDPRGAHGAEAASTDRPPEDRPPSAQPRVLVVDDAEDIRMLLRLRLDRSGEYQVVGEAADGLEAIEQARALQPDVVLLDIAMPRMDGLEALPQIRAAVPDVRVIVLSGFSRETLEQDALAAGADRYLLKGTRTPELLEALASVLGSG
jgi:PAS domain S-box-containing protein